MFVKSRLYEAIENNQAGRAESISASIIKEINQFVGLELHFDENILLIVKRTRQKNCLFCVLYG
ncbi:MAG: hypothetical protein CVV33_02070 [Methanomicrobiales archaeon HGW-Methanomicrobiales-4]|nr:MAG: hypothetical protein CVV33_02070 [Methanomicrobiales archaeon HGW-Methanomicrobiales-4]